MSIICYRNADGEMIAQRNPTKEQWDAMRADWRKQHGKDAAAAAIEIYRRSSVLLRYLSA